MGTLWGEIVADNFSQKNAHKRLAQTQEKNVVFYFDQSVGTQFYNDIKEMEGSAEFGYERFSHKEKLGAYVKATQEALQKGDDLYWEFIGSDWKDLNILDLWALFKKQLDVFNLIYGYYHACQPQYFTKIEEVIRENLTQTVPADKFTNVYGVLMTAEDFDCLTVEELEWLEVVKTAQSGHSDLAEKIKNHSDKYISLGSVEANTPWDIGYYTKRLETDVAKDVDAKIIETQGEKERNEKLKKEYIKKFEISPEIVTLTGAAAKIGTLRFDLRFGWTKLGYTANLILAELSRRDWPTLVNEKSIWDVRQDELESLMSGQEVSLSPEDIKDRQQAFLFVVEDEITSFYSGAEAQQKKKELIPDENHEVKELRGAVACRGKVMGRAVKFSWLESELAKKMEMMHPGDILVAGQTRPFLMPAIQKAGAIVTDEGGITSHAAIVSRELNKPCVIGTKIATQVLSDGDLVEVDAEQGVVRIIDQV